MPVFGVRECDGTHDSAMQFIRGEDLDKVLDDLTWLGAAPAMSSEESVAHSLLTGRFTAPAAGGRGRDHRRGPFTLPLRHSLDAGARGANND